MTNSSAPDKRALYGEYERSQRWQDRLWRKLCFKAVDIPDEDMNVNVRNGWGWKELLVIGTLAIGGWVATTKSWETSLSPPPPAPPGAVDTDTVHQYEFGKYVSGGPEAQP